MINFKSNLNAKFLNKIKIIKLCLLSYIFLSFKMYIRQQFVEGTY